MIDDVSPSCDQGAHERCPGCACGCHVTDTPPALGAPGGADRSRRRRRPRITGVGSLIAWDAHRDPRVLIQVLSAAIPGAIALGLLAWCIVLASQGLL